MCCQLITRERFSHHNSLSRRIFVLLCICLRFPSKCDFSLFLSFFCLFVSQEVQCLNEQHESCSVWEYMLGSKLLWHILYQLFLCDRNQWIKIRSYLLSRSEWWRTEEALLIHVMGYWLWPQGEYICRHRMTLRLPIQSDLRCVSFPYSLSQSRYCPI